MTIIAESSSASMDNEVRFTLPELECLRVIGKIEGRESAALPREMGIRTPGFGLSGLASLSARGLASMTVDSVSWDRAAAAMAFALNSTNAWISLVLDREDGSSSLHVGVCSPGADFLLTSARGFENYAFGALAEAPGLCEQLRTLMTSITESAEHGTLTVSSGDIKHVFTRAAVDDAWKLDSTARILTDAVQATAEELAALTGRGSS